jgi:hypothetical protein
MRNDPWNLSDIIYREIVAAIGLPNVILAGDRGMRKSRRQRRRLQKIIVAAIYIKSDEASSRIGM